jgi:hypothetical protein
MPLVKLAQLPDDDGSPDAGRHQYAGGQETGEVKSKEMAACRLVGSNLNNIA